MHRSIVASICGAVLVSLTAAATHTHASTPGAPATEPTLGTGAAPTYEVYAVRYGTLRAFPLNGLVAGADSAKKVDVALMVWLLEGDGRKVLVDAGFYRDRFVTRWRPAEFSRPSQA